MKFYLPDFWHHFELNSNFIMVLEKNPEWFYDNIEIGGVYGSFPEAIWNGGRTLYKNLIHGNINPTIKYFNDKGIPLKFTFTNSQIKEEHLSDVYCNELMMLANNGFNQVVLNSGILKKYIKTKYPDYKIIASTTINYNQESQESDNWDDYYLITADYNKNNTEEMFQYKEKGRYEILLNSYCGDNCKFSKQHYKQISIDNLDQVDDRYLEHARTQPNYKALCRSVHSGFFDLFENRNFVTVEDLYGKYHNSGFKHFKIEGRTQSMYDVLESYLYYMVKPEFKDTARLHILKQIAGRN